MSDETPYQPIRIAIPDDHPLFDTEGFTDVLAEFYATLTLVKPVEPVRLTQEQLDEVRAMARPAPLGPAPQSLLGTPIVIVERVEDSTPYQRRLETLRLAASAAMKVPYPKPKLPGPFESMGC